MRGEVSMASDAGQTAEYSIEAKPKRRWFQFSLRTLLIVMAWSAVVVWMNTTPHYSEASTSFSRVTFGWPWTYNLGYDFSSESFYSDPRKRTLEWLISVRWRLLKLLS
jgi:hypothetical protein